MSFQGTQAQNEKVIARLIKRNENAILREYAIALRNVRSELAKAFDRYAVGGTLTREDMARYSRLANLEEQIFGEVNKLTGKTAVKLKGGIGEIYQASYYRTAFALETGIEARLGFGMLNPETIKRAVENPLDRVGFLKRNRLNQDRLKAQLSSELTQGLIRGEAYQTIGARLSQRMGLGANNAATIARTEMHRTQMSGLRDSFNHAENIGVEFTYVWVSSMDGRTRDDHADMDGRTATMIDGVPMFELPDGSTTDAPGNSGEPSQDVNCRCTMRGEIEGYGPKFRRVRGEGVIPYKDFNSWKKGRIDG